ncbi:MAG: RNA polymerase sporulation sigma factor SigK [Clostridia bacterium]|nr:RNA polymerase sporulation sigma factor SigK [Clostridia bacterium]
MLSYLLGFGLLNVIFLALHVTNTGTFPRPLSAKEEAVMLERFAAGDQKAREKLIVHNLRLVAHIVKKYYACGKEQDDLISIGTIGLIKGINTFNAEKSIKLATYASRCIENEILMSLRADKKTAGDVLFNDPIDFDNEGNPLTLLDIIADDNDIPDAIDLKIKAEHLMEHIQTVLSPREKMIIFERYGLNGAQEKTQMELAHQLNISRSYVSRIEKKALSKLRSAYLKS